ncbi:cysteine hydrolase family protein [Chromobacterium phragmitis]|uniref:Cysteine hydrolase family protein n=1 Tax=Chromobacterium phragmitis TaxID=2202141 RepID=A0ABV0IZH6_9NEIS
MSAFTLRHICGAAARTSLPENTALVLIDFQNEYFDGALPLPDAEAALERAQALRVFAAARGWPVVHVRHQAPAGSPLFAAGQPSSAIHAALRPNPGELVVDKREVSAFVGTDLAARLRGMGTDTLMIAGLMTHACVAGAARDAVPAGFEVIVAADACATRDLQPPGGEPVPHRQLHLAALAAIADTFGDVLETAEIMSLPRAGATGEGLPC